MSKKRVLVRKVTQKLCDPYCIAKWSFYLLMAFALGAIAREILW